MGTEQRLAYESIRDQLKSNLFIQIKEQGLEAGKLSVLHGILKLRMACNSSELIKDEALFNYDSVKTQVLMDELQNLPAGSKALVFSQFTSMLDLLEKEFVANNMSFFRLDGSTKVDERQERVNAFNSDETDARVFLLSLKAGNAGLNLTSADYVFLFDPWWNRAVEQQAIDRTHRIGQTRSVFAYRMLCRDSIEERILQLQQRKSKVSEELIGAEDAGFIQRLTEDELAFLFS
ncbi:MAG: SWF/SNF helicase family protein [Chitinophagaceae bacterium]|nr:SWF/SNF helicase family protein [Chitinophagaceae bacterium]